MVNESKGVRASIKLKNHLHAYYTDKILVREIKRILIEREHDVQILNEESNHIWALIDTLERNSEFKRQMMEETVSLVTEDDFDKWFKKD